MIRSILVRPSVSYIFAARPINKCAGPLRAYGGNPWAGKPARSDYIDSLFAKKAGTVTSARAGQRVFFPPRLLTPLRAC